MRCAPRSWTRALRRRCRLPERIVSVLERLAIEARDDQLPMVPVEDAGNAFVVLRERGFRDWFREVAQARGVREGAGERW